MNELQIIDNIEIYIDNSNIVWFNLEHIANGLDIIKVDKKNNKEYKRINKQLLQKWLFSFGIINSEYDELPKYVPDNILFAINESRK